MSLVPFQLAEMFLDYNWIFCSWFFFMERINYKHDCPNMYSEWIPVPVQTISANGKMHLKDYTACIIWTQPNREMFIIVCQVVFLTKLWSFAAKGYPFLQVLSLILSLSHLSLSLTLSLSLSKAFDP